MMSTSGWHSSLPPPPSTRTIPETSSLYCAIITLTFVVTAFFWNPKPPIASSQCRSCSVISASRNFSIRSNQTAILSTRGTPPTSRSGTSSGTGANTYVICTGGGGGGGVDKEDEEEEDELAGSPPPAGGQTPPKPPPPPNSLEAR